MPGGYEVFTAPELERVMATKLAGEYPLPPEISLMDGDRADDFYAFLEFFELYGMEDHPLVRIFAGTKIDSGMASAIGRHAHYGDRLAHYAAWLGRRDPVSFVDASHAGGNGTVSVTHTRGNGQPSGQTRGTERGRKNGAPSRCPPTPLGGIRRPFFRTEDGYFENEVNEDE
jgi:hypothetical protein